MTLSTITEKHQNMRFLYALLFAALFSIIGWAVPELYFKYLDNTEYLVITQPMSVDKKIYAPCENTIVTTQLTAKADLEVDSLTELVLVREDGAEVRTGQTIEATIPIRRLESHTVSGILPLSCELEAGVYFWAGTASYRIKDIPHTQSFISDTFTVEIPEEMGEEEVVRTATPSGKIPAPHIIIEPAPVKEEEQSFAPFQQPAPQTTTINQSTTTVNQAPPNNPEPDPEEPDNNGQVEVCLPIVGCVL